MSDSRPLRYAAVAGRRIESEQLDRLVSTSVFLIRSSWENKTRLSPAFGRFVKRLTTNAATKTDCALLGKTLRGKPYPRLVTVADSLGIGRY